MDEDELACTSSDECVTQDIGNQGDNILKNHILQLHFSRLNDNCIMVVQEELQLMQRSSYYLEIQRDDRLPTADQQQHTLHLSDSTVWSLIDEQRLQRAMTLANTQVKLLLTVLGLLYQEIIRGCQEIEAFIVKNDQGLVDSDAVDSIQQVFQQTSLYMRDFKTRMTRNLGPLDLQNQLIPSTVNFPIPQLRASLIVKMPVIFDRSESCARSDSVYLCWEVAGEQSKQLNQQFEIHVKSLHPSTNEHDQFSKSTCQSYNIHINNLISDRYYQFSVKRLHAVNLVYGMWFDTIILKTLDISK